jgi:hypothetical protein
MDWGVGVGWGRPVPSMDGLVGGMSTVCKLNSEESACIDPRLRCLIGRCSWALQQAATRSSTTPRDRRSASECSMLCPTMHSTPLPHAAPSKPPALWLPADRFRGDHSRAAAADQPVAGIPQGPGRVAVLHVRRWAGGGCTLHPTPHAPRPPPPPSCCVAWHFS